MLKYCVYEDGKCHGQIRNTVIGEMCTHHRILHGYLLTRSIVTSSVYQLKKFDCCARNIQKEFKKRRSALKNVQKIFRT